MRMTSYLSHLALYVAMWAVVTAVFIGGAGFLMAALWFVLRETMPPTVAALYTGLGALAAGILIIVVGHAARHRRSAQGGLFASLTGSGRSGHEHEFAAELGAIIGREAASLVSAHTGRAAVGAAAVGFVVGASPRLREVLREILK